MMRNLAFVLMAIVCFGSCRKEDPTPTPKPKPDKEEPKKPEENKPEVTIADIEAYYAFDKTSDLAVAQAQIAATTSEKEVNNKKLQIKEAEMTNLKATEGTFTLVVKSGTVNGKDFSKSFNLSGFKKVSRPDDQVIAKRMQAEWSVAPEVYLQGIDLESLYLDGKTEKFTTETLSPYVRFYSSSVSGEQYVLTTEEVKGIQIKEVKYTTNETSGAGELTFKTVYKGVTSTSALTLSLNRNEYYAQRVTLNPDFAKSLYMRGVYQYLSIYVGSILKYDTDKYAATLKEDSKLANNSSNSLSFSIELHRKGVHSDKVIAVLPFEVTSFKPLETLKQDIFMSQDSEFIEVMSKKLKTWQRGTDLVQHLNTGLDNWMTKSKWVFKYPGNPQNLTWSKVRVNGSEQNLLSGSSSRNEGRDVYLLSPKFQVVSAELNGTTLKGTVELISANDVSLSGVTFPFTVLSLKL